ncbi:O-methyltransferase [Punctularia strigosozonata HHB-11173 SS5]|uniref:O-methyltransferase n=1 Tax=Punctularia strigosozonata (strain HHB-11173) TaxID=741275 RepID=R7S3H7_PUNST|nr:O-methyltransferase [Punctularia strigosozonata HHB-11173 SS5]EIN04748.1 O-methyltransferase [Punctularia strigosozonata HHB-11173 SS5]
MTFAELRALHALIGTALDDIQRTYTASAAPHPLHPPDADPDGTSPPDFPSLSAPYDPSSPSEALLHDPAVARACARIVAAAGQLTAAVQNPFLTICDATMTYHLPACMRVLEASHVVEILREAGPDGLHVERIAARVPYPIDSRTLAHVLRLLATHHVLAERAPDVFANNRLSSYIDTGKSVAEILSNPDSKYADTDGVAAFVGLNTDELFKSSAYLADALLRLPEDRPPTRRPHQEGEGEEGGEEGEERALTFCSRLHRFGAAMRGSARWEGESGILDGFDWASLEPGALVVDVGGGVGSHAMRLARAFPALRFVVQDRARVCEMGREVWKVQFPGAVEGGRVVFQGHDFFDEQPRVAREADVFLLRVITHDWPDADVRRILGRLREVAKPGARLVVGEHVLGEACHLGGRGADGAWDWPLLANGGRASACGHYMDMTMLSMFNAQERTAREMRALWASAGWCVGEVRRAAGNGGFGYIVAEPAVELHQGRL